MQNCWNPGLDVNGDSLPGPLIIGTFEKRASGVQLSALYAASPSVLLYEADIGGTQYCNSVRKIGKYLKYRVENRRNTDTAFMIGHAYLKLYPSRVSVYLKHVLYLFE